ncbi:molybdopterin-binding protein [Streptomyces sp. I05A-00742]|uniref:competence/damage-inducible protein A n=1 Tax=Streptomyces sp. I05A-00742 TaxID=2732853 RepID=UPI001487D646|nr:competence/damage-inducible protein A [Streptomyces sp. I05A-00742]
MTARPAPAPPAGLACVVTVGDELLNGEVTDTNGTEASRVLLRYAVRTRSRHTVPDDEHAISEAITLALGQAPLVLVIGGLGPTSDDVTRFAVARALDRALEERAEAWTAIQERLADLGIHLHPDNRRQAQFPQGSTLLPNPNGTAWGAVIADGDRHVVLLPGPPKECLPMLEAALTAVGLSPAETSRLQWRTMGLPEPEVASRVDAVLDALGTRSVTAGYCWRYPYVDVTIVLPADEETHDLEERVSRALEGHVVSRDGTGALDRLSGALGGRGIRLDDTLSHGRFAQWAAGLPAAGDAGSPLHIAAGGTWHTGSPDDHRGFVSMTCRVTADGTTRTHSMEEPNLGPEVLDGAAHFIAWSVLRSLDAGTPA